MMFMHFTSQIILLAVGFGVGYALLIVASKQKDSLKTTGSVLGWVLIVMAIILAVLSCHFSMKMSKRLYMRPCPMHKVIEHRGYFANEHPEKEHRMDKKHRKMINESVPQGAQKSKTTLDKFDRDDDGQVDNDNDNDD